VIYKDMIFLLSVAVAVAGRRLVRSEVALGGDEFCFARAVPGPDEHVFVGLLTDTAVRREPGPAHPVCPVQFERHWHAAPGAAWAICACAPGAVASWTHSR
jgi:hypothetical protein